jgi:hypothetical protein
MSNINRIVPSDMSFLLVYVQASGLHVSMIARDEQRRVSYRTLEEPGF